MGLSRHPPLTFAFFVLDSLSLPGVGSWCMALLGGTEELCKNERLGGVLKMKIVRNDTDRWSSRGVCCWGLTRSFLFVGRRRAWVTI